MCSSDLMVHVAVGVDASVERPGVDPVPGEATDRAGPAVHEQAGAAGLQQEPGRSAVRVGHGGARPEHDEADAQSSSVSASSSSAASAWRSRSVNSASDAAPRHRFRR